MANKITTAIDFETRDGARSLGQLRTEIKNTDGAFGKMKVAGSGAMQQIKANAGEMALAAGAALVGFGAKAVGAFTDSAIAAGQFADATGLSTEQASQWISVADDLGLNADTVQKAFLRLNKEIGEGGGLAEEYGLKLQRTANGTADVNATMLEAIEVIGGIKDPTERAAAAQEIFGRSYAEVAEIVLGDSDKIKAALESTSDAQIFDEDEVRKAREYRRVMDEFNDMLTDLTMTIGEGLTPALSDAVDNATKLTRGLESIPGGANAIGNGLTLLTGGFQGLTKSLMESNEETDEYEYQSGRAAGRSREFAREARDAADAAGETGDEVETAAEKLSEYRNNTNDAMAAMEGAYDAGVDVNAMFAEQQEAAEEAAGGVDEVSDSFERLKGEMDIRDAWDDVVEGAEEFADKVQAAKDAEDEFGKESRETAAANREMEASLRNRVRAIIDYVTQADNIPAEKVTDIQALLDQGSIDAAEAELAKLERQRTTVITARTIIANAPSSDFGYRPQITQGNRNSGQRVGATGGLVLQRTDNVTLGEAGPEAVIPLDKAPGNKPLGDFALGGPQIVMAPGAIQITAIGSPTPELERLVSRAIQDYNRRNGRSR